MQSIRDGKIEPVLSIIDAGFPVNAPVLEFGATIAMHVTATCSADFLSQIMARGADLNASDELGRTAIHFACRAGKEDTFRVLVDNDEVDVDAVTNAGVTPLMMAIESGNV